jgi:heptosyltransferase-3
MSNIKTNTPLSVVVFRTGHLGDTVCAISAFFGIRQHFVGADLTLLCDASKSGKVPAQDVIASLKCFDRVIAYESGRALFSWWQLWRNLRAIRADVLIYLTQQREPDNCIRRKVRFFNLAGVKKVLVVQGTEQLEPGWVPNEVQRLRSGLLAVGIPSADSRCLIPVNEVARDSVIRKLAQNQIEANQPFVAFCGGGKTATQRWPLDRYAGVMSEMYAKTGIPVVAVGTPEEERAYREQITPVFGPLQFVPGGLNFSEMFELFRMAAFYLGNDTGPMHAAASVGCPVFAVISARNLPGAWDPDVQPSQVIRHRTECENCFLERCVKEGHRCLLNIGPAHVTEELFSFMEKLGIGNRNTDFFS